MHSGGLDIVRVTNVCLEERRFWLHSVNTGVWVYPKRTNNVVRLSTPGNSTKDQTSEMELDCIEKTLQVPLSECLSRRAPSLFFRPPSTFHTTLRDKNGRSSVLYGLTGLVTRLDPISNAARPRSADLRKLTLREATSSALNTLVSGLPYQIVWLSTHAVHATSCKTCESLFAIDKWPRCFRCQSSKCPP